jgi:hypothetical protein
VLSHPSGMTVSSRALGVLSDALRAQRNQRRTRWRKLSPGRQALLAVAHLRKGETYADLACGFRIGTSTVYRYIREAGANAELKLTGLAEDPLQPEHRPPAHRRSSDPHDRQRMIRLAKLAVGLLRHTAVVTSQPSGADGLIADLLADPIGAADVRAHVPATPGLYAWWASPDLLSTLVGPPHPSIPNLRLLYVGIATKPPKSARFQPPRANQELHSAPHPRRTPAR